MLPPATPRWYTGLPSWLVSVLWTLVIGAVLVGGTWLWLRSHDEVIRTETRAAMVKDAQQAAQQAWPTERARWQRERDSLTKLVARRDTLLVTRLMRVRDTLWLPADTSPAVRYTACRAELDYLATDCGLYRDSTQRLLAVKDSVHQADSLTEQSLSLQLVHADTALAQALRRPGWKTVGKASAWSAAIGAGLCFLFCP